MKLKPNDLIRKLEAKYPVALVIQEMEGHLFLHKIKVDELWRGQGIGKLVMKHLCTYCNTHGFTMKLAPTDAFGCEFERLIRFYKRFGFRFEKDSEEMVRPPKVQKNDYFKKKKDNNN